MARLTAEERRDEQSAGLSGTSTRAGKSTTCTEVDEGRPDMKGKQKRRFGMGRARVLATGLALFTLAPCARASEEAQAGTGAERRSVTVGHYGANGLHRCLMGSGYRDLWMTPVSVEVLDLSREAGGLRPVARVGGQQTRALALEGGDGRSYTFRGLVKDPSHVLDTADPLLKDSSVARKIVDDLMSAQHPASDLIVSGLLEAAGIPSPAWRLVALPDDPALGAFREEFKGAVGVFAEYPQPAKGAVPGFLGATEIIDHLAMYERIESAGVEAIDARALLRARLTDLFMGDWDRHRKQWRWARLPDRPLWTPIPEDRDQAFSRYDGYVMDRPGARSPLPGVRAALRQDRRSHLQRLGPGPPAARRLHARGLRAGGEGAAGAPHRRRDRGRGAAHASGVARDRRLAARQGPPRAARGPAARGRGVLPAPREEGGRLPDESQRAGRRRAHAAGRHGDHGPRARPREPARRRHLPPRVPGGKPRRCASTRSAATT